MKKDLTVLYASGMSVNDVGKALRRTSSPVFDPRALPTEDVLASTDVKGFPILASGSSKALSGYIGRTELRYVLGIFFPYGPDPWNSQCFRQGPTHG